LHQFGQIHTPVGEGNVAKTRVTPELQVRTIKSDGTETEMRNLIKSNANEVEDAFSPFLTVKDGPCLSPPYDPKQLEELALTNNALGPCIDAMVANVDGTGYSIEVEGAEEDDDETVGDKVSTANEKGGDLGKRTKPGQLEGTDDGDTLPIPAKKADPPQQAPMAQMPPPKGFKVKYSDPTGDPVNEHGRTPAEQEIHEEQEKIRKDKAKAEADAKIAKVEEFFAEVWPGESFTTVRKKLRRDQEITGNAYLEALRNPAGELVFLRRLVAHTLRLCKLDKGIPTDVKVVRGGTEKSIKVNIRWRRFAQVINNKLVYFKEFGCPYDLNKTTGEWSKDKLPAADRATEILHFKCKEDPNSPYGLPRWIAQTPSVVGSRKAEEHNLEFFNSGGVPPVLITVSGGELAPEATAKLEQLMSGRSKDKLRAAVIEAYSSDGTLDSSSKVKVEVERFGSEQQDDSMFENYDEKCFERIRAAFRLPPLFVGKSEDYSFATAFASYTVAEAQVFQPERDEFDEVVNTKIMKEIGGEGLVFRSLPLAVKDSETQLKAIELAADALSNEGKIDALNEISNLSLKMREGADDDPNPLPMMGPGMDPTNPDPMMPPIGKTGGGLNTNGAPNGVTPAVKKADWDEYPDNAPGLVALAETVSEVMKRGVSSPEDAREMVRLSGLVASLSATEQRTFKSLLASMTIVDPSHDPRGTADLAACAFAVMSGHLTGE